MAFFTHKQVRINMPTYLGGLIGSGQSSTHIAALLVCSLLQSQHATAQIRTDGSLGPAAQNLNGPNYLIPQNLGRLSGNNLFHSFSSFNINAGESALFIASSPAIANVISRVTGGTRSAINGTLSMISSGSPNFYFINPAGVTFGAGATIDVPGAFHVSTANYLKFPDGNFYADASKASTFSSAPPEAFGFLGTMRSAINIEQDASLFTRPLQPISVVAGDIEVNNASVSTQGGDIRVAAVGASIQEIPFTGNLPVTAGKLSVINGGSISTVNGLDYDGGLIAVSAGEILINSQGSSKLTGIFTTSSKIAQTKNLGGSSGDEEEGDADLPTSEVVFLDSTRQAGNVQVTSAGNLILLNGGQVSSLTNTSGTAGSVRINAGSILVDRQGSAMDTGIFSNTDGGSGNAGNVDVTASGKISVLNGGEIDSSSYSQGKAGIVTVSAASIILDRQTSNVSTGIFSEAISTTGQAGNVQVHASGNISIVNGASISSSTATTGQAGTTTVSADSVSIDGRGKSAETGIFSTAAAGSTGNAGNVEVTSNNISIVNGGQIDSSTYAAGNAGRVKVTTGNMVIDGQGTSADTGIFSIAEASSRGNAGNVEVVASGKLTVSNSGQIDSSTYARGNAGKVKVTAASVLIDGLAGTIDTGIYSKAEAGSSGNAGNVEVMASDNIQLINRGQIDSSTYATGSAGNVSINAGSLTIRGQGDGSATGIFSEALGSTGNAGSVEVLTSAGLTLSSEGAISSSTNSQGAAGSVRIRAANLLLTDNASIESRASENSSGQTGSVSISATEAITLSNANFSIKNNGSPANSTPVTPSLLAVSAPMITLSKGSVINASATGNVAASNVNISYTGRLSLDGSTIRTSAVDGNGGSIAINGGEVASLANSQVTTSVAGVKNGNGGDIRLRSQSLIMRTGFIQANTAAANALGGNVTIDVKNLVPSLSTLSLGGTLPLTFKTGISGFNVIQAAAPTGLSGNVQTSAPSLDIAGSLVELKYQIIDTGGLGRSPCRINRGSSLTMPGRGGFPSAAGNLLEADTSRPVQKNVSGTSEHKIENGLSHWQCLNG